MMKHHCSFIITAPSSSLHFYHHCTFRQQHLSTQQAKPNRQQAANRAVSCTTQNEDLPKSNSFHTHTHTFRQRPLRRRRSMTVEICRQRLKSTAGGGMAAVLAMVSSVMPWSAAAAPSPPSCTRLHTQSVIGYS